MASKAPRTDDGLPVDIELPLIPEMLTLESLVVLLKHFKFPPEIRNNNARLRENLVYRLRRHAIEHDAWKRKTAQTAALNHTLDTNPAILAQWPAVQLHARTGKYVCYVMDYPALGVVVVETDVFGALAEDARRAALKPNPYATPAPKAKLHIISKGEFSNLADACGARTEGF